jgi:5-hydroxyisourate hydrolase-like protein (transthyretin family)
MANRSGNVVAKSGKVIGVGMLASFIAGLALEATKPFLGNWLPWAPGSLTVLVKHQTPQTPLVAAGEMTLLRLKRDNGTSMDVKSPQGGICTLCRLRSGSYTIMAWVNDMLAISDCRAEVTPGALAEASCFIAQPQAKLQIEVRNKRSGAPMTDVSVQIKSHAGHLWRGPDHVDKDGRSPWNYLQATSLESESYVIEVLKGDKVLVSEDGIKLKPGVQTTKVVSVGI